MITKFGTVIRQDRHWYNLVIKQLPQQLKSPFYLSVQMLQSILKINRLQLRSFRFQVVPLVVGFWNWSPASPKSCRSAKKYDSIYAKWMTALLWNFTMINLLRNKIWGEMLSPLSLFKWKCTTKVISYTETI